MIIFALAFCYNLKVLTNEIKGLGPPFQSYLELLCRIVIILFLVRKLILITASLQNVVTLQKAFSPSLSNLYSPMNANAEKVPSEIFVCTSKYCHHHSYFLSSVLCIGRKDCWIIQMNNQQSSLGKPTVLPKVMLVLECPIHLRYLLLNLLSY